MKNKLINSTAILLGTVLLAACTQSTPSMMNSSRIQLSHETAVEQVPLSELTDTNLTILAKQYRQYGSGPLDLVMTYNPKARDFTAMKAVNELKRVEKVLRQKGVADLTTQTLAVPDGKPSLMVSFDTATALAPADCTPMPGLNDYQTGRFIGDYKFGCGVETAFSKQIARPADLEGNSDMGVRSGRRDANMIEGYSAGVPSAPLEGIERSDLQTN